MMFKKVDGGVINNDKDSFEAYEMARKRAKRELFVIETLQKIDNDLELIKDDIIEIKDIIGKN